MLSYNSRVVIENKIFVMYINEFIDVYDYTNNTPYFKEIVKIYLIIPYKL